MGLAVLTLEVTVSERASAAGLKVSSMMGVRVGVVEMDYAGWRRLRDRLRGVLYVDIRAVTLGKAGRDSGRVRTEVNRGSDKEATSVANMKLPKVPIRAKSGEATTSPESSPVSPLSIILPFHPLAVDSYLEANGPGIHTLFLPRAPAVIDMRPNSQTLSEL